MTAVEWLELNLLGLISFDSEELRTKYKDRLSKAKEMEKQQMIEMHDKGFDSVVQLNDDYAIGFADWLYDNNWKLIGDGMCLNLETKEIGYINELMTEYKK